MCLGIPVQLIEVTDTKGIALVGEVKKEIDLRFLPEAVQGDYVILHAGFAMKVIDPEVAAETYAMVREHDQAMKEAEESDKTSGVESS
jgi:hydrogenase expression/formation protein HypC